MLVKFKLHTHIMVPLQRGTMGVGYLGEPTMSSPEIAVNPWAVDYLRRDIIDNSLCHLTIGVHSWIISSSFEDALNLINVATQGAARK